MAIDLPAGVAGRTFSDVGVLVRSVTLGPLEPGELVQSGNVLPARSAEPRPEFSFGIDAERAVAGSLRPGDRIDVLVTYGTGAGSVTQLVSRRARVLGIDGGASNGLSDPRRQVVTVAVTSPDDILALTNAARAGEITVARNTGVKGEPAARTFTPDVPEPGGHGVVDIHDNTFVRSATEEPLMAGERYVVLGLAHVRSRRGSPMSPGGRRPDRSPSSSSSASRSRSCGPDSRPGARSRRCWSTAASGAVDRDLVDLAGRPRVSRCSWSTMSARPGTGSTLGVPGRCCPPSFARNELLDALSQHEPDDRRGRERYPVPNPRSRRIAAWRGRLDRGGRSRRHRCVDGGHGRCPGSRPTMLATRARSCSPTARSTPTRRCSTTPATSCPASRSWSRRTGAGHPAGRDPALTFESRTAATASCSACAATATGRSCRAACLRGGARRPAPRVPHGRRRHRRRHRGRGQCGSVDVEERNIMARTVIMRADVVVVVGGARRQGHARARPRLVDDLREHGVAADRIVAVVNGAGRNRTGPGRADAGVRRAEPVSTAASRVSSDRCSCPNGGARRPPPRRRPAARAALTGPLAGRGAGGRWTTSGIAPPTRSGQPAARADRAGILGHLERPGGREQ